MAALLLGRGARTTPSSRLAKEVIHLGNRPVCFTTWYYNNSKPHSASQPLEKLIAQPLTNRRRSAPIFRV
ncbi:MAG: hypothetical protein P8O22_08195 [Akkermansiaceae bacterium]|nr:hypothetical protein [Akkermansiaceae bacterium]